MNDIFYRYQKINHNINIIDKSIHTNIKQKMIIS